MPSLANKLAIAATVRAGEQCQVKGRDPYAESLIRVLSLQATTRSEARSAADDLGPLSEAEPNEALIDHEAEQSEALDDTEEKFSTLTMSKEKSSILDLIRNAQELDPQCRRISSQLRDLSLEDPSLALAPQRLQRYSEDGLIRDVGRVLVPPQEAIRNQLLEVYHDCPSGGHWGRDKTLELIQRHFTWDGITDDVRAYVATCPICQGKAIHRHKPYGKLKPLPIPTDMWNSPFKEISLDWITGLPPSIKNGQKYNSILTILCRVTKYALFIPTRDDANAADFAELFFEHVECHLRIDVADNVSEKRIPAAKDRIEKLHQLRQELRVRLIEAQERMAAYYNARHVPKQFKTGSFVKLSTKNLKLKYPKLAPRWIGPFQILKRIGGQAYELSLPEKYARLHPVFPVQLLEEYRRRHDDAELMKMPDRDDPQDEWEVEEVRDKQRIKGVVHYLVKWAGWPSEYNSYEPASHLTNAPKAVANFERKLKRKRAQTAGTYDDMDHEDVDPTSALAPRKRAQCSRA